MAYLCCVLSNGDNSCFQSLEFQKRKRNLFKFIAEWKSFPELAKKKLQIIHIRKYRDCCAQLYDGIPPKKLWTRAKMKQFQRAHLMGKTGGSVPAGESTGTKDGISNQGLAVAHLFLYKAMGWKLDSEKSMTEGSSHISKVRRLKYQ